MTNEWTPAIAGHRVLDLLVNGNSLKVGDIAHIGDITVPWIKKGLGPEELDDGLTWCVTQGWLEATTKGWRLTERGLNETR